MKTELIFLLKFTDYRTEKYELVYAKDLDSAIEKLKTKYPNVYEPQIENCTIM